MSYANFPLPKETPPGEVAAYRRGFRDGRISKEINGPERALVLQAIMFVRLNSDKVKSPSFELLKQAVAAYEEEDRTWRNG